MHNDQAVDEVLVDQAVGAREPRDVVPIDDWNVMNATGALRMGTGIRALERGRRVPCPICSPPAFTL